MKINIRSSQSIVPPRDPILPMEVTTKNYADTLILTIDQRIVKLEEELKAIRDQIKFKEKNDERQPKD